MPSEPEESPTLVQILLLAAGVNVVLYTLWSVAIGGTALTGTIVDGHYFVQSRGHGAEVSSTVWHINRWHGIGVIVEAQALSRMFSDNELWIGPSVWDVP